MAMCIATSGRTNHLSLFFSAVLIVHLTPSLGVGIGISNSGGDVFCDKARGPRETCPHLVLGCGLVQLHWTDRWDIERCIHGISNDVGLCQHELQI